MPRPTFRAIAIAAAILATLAARLPHMTLARSAPAAESVITATPTRLTLWFTARPQLALSRVRLVGAAGDVSLGPVVAEPGNALRADVAGPLAPGAYRVHWQTAGADGHVPSGEIGFVVSAPGRDTTPAHVHAAGPVTREGSHTMTHGMSLAERVARWWEFLALLSVLGILAFLFGVLPPLASRGVRTGDASQVARGYGEIAAVVYLLAAAYRLVAQSGTMGSSQAFADVPSVADIVLRSSWGNGWLFGVLGAVLVLPGFALSKRSVAAGAPLTLTGALAMALSPALSGHAATGSPFVASVTFDALHVVAVGAWVGGLLMLVVVGVPAMLRLADGNRDAAVSALVNSFHPIALLCAPLAVAAGVGSAVVRVGSFEALTSTPYGLALIWKSLLALAVVGLGAWNSTRARRRLGTAEATTRFRRSAAVELALAALVLAATTQLVSLPPPADMIP